MNALLCFTEVLRRCDEARIQSGKIDPMFDSEAMRFGFDFEQEIIVKNTFKALALAGVLAALSTAAFAQSYDQAPASGGSTYQGQSNAFQNAPGPYDNEMGDRSSS